jgi:hypothetical protein
MVDWDAVGAADVRSALAEADQLGSREFTTRYRFGRARDATVWLDGAEYDARSVIGLAYMRVTGRSVPSDEFDVGGEDAAVRRLKALGFDVVVDPTLSPRPRKAGPAVRRPASATRIDRADRPAPSGPKRVVVRPRPTDAALSEAKICPRCFMALPATGICDNCD